MANVRASIRTYAYRRGSPLTGYDFSLPISDDAEVTFQGQLRLSDITYTTIMWVFCCTMEASQILAVEYLLGDAENRWSRGETPLSKRERT